MDWLTLAPFLVAFIAYIVRLEKSLTSIQKDISYIKAHCYHCKENPDSDHGDGRTDEGSTEGLG